MLASARTKAQVLATALLPPFDPFAISHEEIEPGVPNNIHNYEHVYVNDKASQPPQVPAPVTALIDGMNVIDIPNGSPHSLLEHAADIIASTPEDVDGMDTFYIVGACRASTSLVIFPVPLLLSMRLCGEPHNLLEPYAWCLFFPVPF